jgi:hypothetical protein
MKTTLRLTVLVGLIGLVVAGCGKDPAAIGSGYSKVFQSADAPTKALWDGALAAVKTNGYAPAIMAFKELAAQTNLTTDQTKAVAETVTAVSDKMYAEANQGKPQAVEAIKQLRSTYRR